MQPGYSKNKQLAEIVLPQYIVTELRRWLANVPGDDPLVPGLANKKTGKMIRKDLEAAGLPYIDEDGKYRDWHALRHTFITREWRSGAPAPVVQKRARHADIRTTIGYSHVTQAELRVAAESVPQLRLLEGQQEEGAA